MTKALELPSQKLKNFSMKQCDQRITSLARQNWPVFVWNLKQQKSPLSPNVYIYTLLLHLYRRFGVEWRGHRYWLKIVIQIVECIRLKMFQNKHSNIRFSFKLLSCLQKSKIILFFKLKTEQHFNNFGWRSLF